ncbi:MAG: HlyD family efflux transporter periplasmic adaptor subunit [Candidatus Onthomonas sp.]
MSTTTKKKSKRKWLTVILVIAVAAAILLAASRLLYPGPGAEANTLLTSSIRSAETQTGSITTSVSGSGTLVSAAAEDITIPEGVEIDTYYVSSGDRVWQGDVLASVDRNSILATLSDIQDQLDELDQQLEEKEDDSVPSKVQAGVAGRVKQINVSVDDSVSAVMAECGSLMILSLDGKMAVDLPASGAACLGASVTVTLSDGSTKEGTVAEQNSSGIVVTLTDNGPVNGDIVTVQTEDGSDLGSGTLYIHSPLSITGYTGTVSSVKVKENEKVSASTTLIKLTDLGHTVEYESLLLQRQSLVNQLQTLTSLYQNNVITAPFDGTIKSIDGEEDAATSSVSSGNVTYSGIGSGFGLSTAAGEQGVLVLLSETAEETPDTGGDTGDSSETGETPDEPATPTPISVPLTAWVQLEGGTIADYAGKFSLVLFYGDEAVQKQKNDANGKVVFDDLTFTAPGSYSFVLSQSAGTDSQISYDTKTSYNILIDVTLGENNELNANVTVDPRSELLIFCNAVLPEEIPSDDPVETPDDKPSEDSSQMPADKPAGDLTQDPSENSTQMPDMGSNGIVVNPGSGSMDGGSISGFSVSGGGSLDTSAATSYSSNASSGSATELSDVTVITIAPDDYMTVSVSVDELDILSIQKDQSASVTIDALGDAPVIGTVTKISTDGSSSGGVTKYTVEITIEKTEQMLANMNASVEIVVDQTENCLIIPEAALNQTGTRTFVYTGYDQETGALTGETEVTTGVSDGTNVEITSGLSENDVVYYNYNDAGGFSMGSFPGGDFGFGSRGGRGGFQ